MKLSTILPVLIGFLSGLALDIILSRFVLDLVLFGTVLVTAMAALAIAHYHKPCKKALPRRKVRKRG
jgi:hypothetical protein